MRPVRGVTLLFLITAELLPGQGSPPPPLRAPTADGAVTFSAQDLPEELAWRLFLLELAALEKEADRLRALGKDDAALRGHFQAAFGLGAAEHAELAAAARSCAGVREVNQPVIEQTLRALRQQPQDPLLRSRLEELRKANQASVLAAVEQLRNTLGPRRFAWVGQQVRRHVASRVKVYGKPGGGEPSSQGGR